MTAFEPCIIVTDTMSLSNETCCPGQVLGGTVCCSNDCFCEECVYVREAQAAWDGDERERDSDDDRAEWLDVMHEREEAEGNR